MIALDALPLHNDEGLHLTRAVEVWNLHPFYDIEDGKVVGVWAIALFYPQNAPVFVGRIATVFVGLIGLAAGIALGRLASGRHAGGWLAGLFWITCPYIFFFERMALADIEAGAAVVLITLTLLPGLSRSYRRRDIIGGFALGLALMFKISAAPFAGVPLLAILLERGQPFRTRLLRLATIYAVALVIVAPASLYSISRGGFFSIARGWVGGPQIAITERTTQNITTFTDTIFTVNGAWIVLLVGVFFAFRSGRRGVYVLGSVAGPLVVMLVFGTEVLDRHFGIVMPLLTVVTAVGVTAALALPGRNIPPTRMALAVAWAAIFMIGWLISWAWLPAYNNPTDFPMTAFMRGQYIADHPSGYGLREAVQALPQTAGSNRVIASMSSDGCRRARFYLPNGASLECTGAGDQARGPIEAALVQAGSVFVLAEDPPVGINPESINAKWTRFAEYPRPGNLTRVTLWRVAVDRARIELATLPCKGSVFPLNYRPLWVREDSNL